MRVSSFSFFVTLASISISGYAQPDMVQSPAPQPVVLAEDIHGLTKQATLGIAEAQFALAQRFERGRGTALNYDEAFVWYRRAAEQGHVPAQFFLGAMYASSRGTTIDISAAVMWYRKAADAGYADAMYPIAYVYENGLGGYEKNNEEALRWYKACAETGNRFALQRLANAYRLGELGLAADAETASVWQSKASAASGGSPVTVPLNRR